MNGNGFDHWSQRAGVVLLGSAALGCVIAVALLALHHSTGSTTPAITALSSLAAAAVGGIAGVLSPSRGGGSAAPAATQSAATITLTPNQGSAGSAFRVIGSGFSPSEAVAIQFDATTLVAATADGNGSFSQTETVPAGVGTGVHRIAATGSQSTSVATAPFTVA